MFRGLADNLYIINAFTLIDTVGFPRQKAGVVPVDFMQPRCLHDFGYAMADGIGIRPMRVDMYLRVIDFEKYIQSRRLA